MSLTIPTRDLVRLAHDLADRSGAVIKPHFRSGLDADDKADASPVTIADREAEAAMRDLLAQRAPDHGVIGEELGRSNEDAELVWVLDPIDGTKAFITGKPIFCTLIGLLHRGRPVLGVIDQPVTGERWLGVLGEPTLHGGRAVRVRPCPGLATARVSTTGPRDFTETKRRAFDRVADRARFATFGGDGYQYGLVALGGVDVVIESGLKLHDFVALAPIVTGAGGVMTDWSGAPLDRGSNGDVVASGDARVHEAVLAILGEGS